MEAGTERFTFSEMSDLLVAPSDGCMRVRFLGDWDLSTAPQLREALDSIDASGHVVFDFSELRYLDSSAMRVLIEFKKRSNSQLGSTAVYYGDNEKARRFMSISGVDTVL